MGNPEALLRCTTLVEQKLREPLSVQDMAAAACWSLYHFCRVFTETMSMGPYDYLVRRRVTEAAKELAATGRRIIDLALDYQFGSPEVFSRCFRRALGYLPSRLRHGMSEASARFLSPLDREMATCVSSASTRPHVTDVDCPPVRLRGLAMLMNVDGGSRLAQLDVGNSLSRLRWALGEAGMLLRSETAYALLDRVGPSCASLFLGHVAPPEDHACTGELEATLPTGHYLVSTAEAKLPLPLLRAHFHSLWYPASSWRRPDEREVFRWSDGAAGERVELLVPAVGEG